MKNELVALTQSISSIIKEDNPHEIIEAYEQSRLAIATLREYSKALEQDFIQVMEGAKEKRVQFGETVYYVAENTTKRFYSDSVIKHMTSENKEVRDCALRCLPKNPKFRATEIYKLQELVKEELYCESVTEGLKMKEMPKEMLDQIKANRVQSGESCNNPQPQTKEA